MIFIQWAHQLAWLILNLGLIAYARIRWPESFVGATLNTLMV